MDKIPKEIKINSITYKVIVDGLPLKGEYAWGRVNYEKQEISIDSRLEDDRQRHTFIHEYIHVADHDNRIKDAGDKLSESEVDRLSTMIMNILNK